MITAQCTKANGSKGQFSLIPFMKLSRIFCLSKLVCDGMCRQQQGFGILIVSAKESYEGLWRVGLMHGKGTYIWENGDSYDGDYRVLFTFHSIFV